MPRYEYHCQNCDHVFDVKQGFHDDPVATCPQCQTPARRRFRPVGVIFKGSGWYVNDYGRKARASSNGDDDTKEAKTSQKSGDSSTETAKQESSTSTSASQE